MIQQTGKRMGFGVIAREYMANRPDYPNELMDWLVSLLKKQDRGILLDVGCGNGQVSKLLARHFRQVIAMDASREQLQFAAKVGNVTYRLGTAESTGLAEESVDLVTAGSAFHWFNTALFNAEVLRVLRPGGVFAAWSITSMGMVFGESKSAQQLTTNIFGFFHHVLGPYWPDAYQHSVTAYRFVPFPFDEIHPVPSVCQLAHWTLSEYIGYLTSWSSISELLRREGPKPLQRFERSLSRDWGPGTRPVLFDLAIRAGRKPQLLRTRGRSAGTPALRA